MLAVGSVGAGVVLGLGHLQTWLEPVVGSHEAEHGVPAWVTTVIALAAVAIGVAIAYRQYATRPVPVNVPRDVSALTVAARRDLYGDSFNEAVFMRPGRLLTEAMVGTDEGVVERSVGGFAWSIRTLSDGLNRLQTGYARTYALSMLGGAALVAGAFLLAGVWR